MESASGSTAATLTYALLAPLWGLGLYFLAQAFVVSDLWVTAISIFVCSVPIALSGLYLSSITKIQRLTYYASKGWLYRIAKRRVGATLFWSGWALMTSVLMLLECYTYTDLEWIVFLLVIPLFWSVFQVARSIVARELRPYLVTAQALRIARRITPLLMLLLYVTLVMLFVELPHYDSLQEAIHARQTVAASPAGSAIVHELSQLLAYFDGAKRYAIGHFGSADAMLAVFLFAAGGFAIFFNACAMLSCLLIPRAEYRRLFAPLSDTETPPPAVPGRIAITMGILTFATLFIYLPGFASLENALRQRSSPFAETRLVLDFMVERIDSNDYLPGTVAKIRAAQLNAMATMTDITSAQLLVEADNAFARMESNVDAFLDWYYQLSTEYLRVAKLLTGDVEDLLAKQLAESLTHGEPFQRFDAMVTQALAQRDAALLAYQETMAGILERNRVEVPDNVTISIIQTLALTDIGRLPAAPEWIGIETRLGAGGVAGVVTTIMVKKIAGKGVFKLAATSAGKLLAGKAVGAAGGIASGAATGAAIGSIVPGAGTAAGAAIGGVVGGVLAGLAVDKGLLALEEAVNRDAFRQEIITVIQETREAFKASITSETEQTDQDTAPSSV
ncbi:hypothetical protein [Nitrosomonas sp. ANs5]|uniref:hypothetical protein n=1 Tax=Nitrosomonas sp. ANs5 TaxID=3423941 RepID=UPI003D3505AE